MNEDEPKRRGAIVRDRDGDEWRRGTTRWSCMTPVGSNGVTNVGRLPWYALVQWYGPVVVVTP